MANKNQWENPSPQGWNAQFAGGDIWNQDRINTEAEKSARAIFERRIKGQLSVPQTDQNA